MPRLTLQQMRYSRLPEVIGACFDNTQAIALAVNAAQERLLFAKEAGNEGWYGTWARMAFNVLQADPYITLGRWGARLMNVSYCKRPIGIENEFYEFLEFGPGNQPKWNCANQLACERSSRAYSRMDVVTFRDIPATGQYIRVRALDVLDTGGDKRVLIQGTDTFDNVLYSQDAATRVAGQFLTLQQPFVDTAPITLKTLSGIQKDVTNGALQFSGVDPDTGEETLLLTMEPSEQVAGYRRYYLGGLPPDCCPVVLNAEGEETVQLEAIVKLNLVPVVVDSDYLLLQNMEAVIAECQSMRYSTMDTPNAKLMAQDAHRQAIRYLMGELAHHMGIDKPASSFYPFGSATLERQAIGTLT